MDSFGAGRLSEGDSGMVATVGVINSKLETLEIAVATSGLDDCNKLLKTFSRELNLEFIDA